MAENDHSWLQKDESWRKRTLHVKMVCRQTGFFAQSSVLSTQSLFFLTPLKHTDPLVAISRNR